MDVTKTLKGMDYLILGSKLFVESVIYIYINGGTILRTSWIMTFVAYDSW